MEISLNSEFEQFVNEQIAKGAYKSVNDIIQEALSLLISKKGIPQERLQMLSNEIDAAWNDLETGKFKDGHKVMKKLISKYEQ